MTASDGPSGLRSFALDGRPPRRFDHVVGKHSSGLAALSGGRFIIAASDGGKVFTWRAASGKQLGSLKLRSKNAAVTGVAEISSGRFVVGTSLGRLSCVIHRGGRDLVEEAVWKAKHSSWVDDIAVRGDTIVTASSDATAAVWSAATRERLAVLRDYNDGVLCAAISEKFIVTGSKDDAIRLHDNASGYTLLRVIEGLHSGWVWRVVPLDENTIFSASADETVAFCSISTRQQFVRVDVGFEVLSAAVTHDGRIACAGKDAGAEIVTPPAAFSTTVKKFALTLPRFSLSIKSEAVASHVATVPSGRRALHFPQHQLKVVNRRRG